MDSGTRFSLEFLGQLYMVLRQYMPLYLRPVCIVPQDPDMVIFKDLFHLFQLDQGLEGALRDAA